MPGTRKLGRTSDHRKAMLRAMVTFLFETGKIETTATRAKEVRAMAEKMVTLGKREDLHAKRQVYGFITKESVAKKVIDIDFKHEVVRMKNYTDRIPLRAFGVVENPSWADFEEFLKERCLPASRAGLKGILREMDVSFYDPLLIIEKTNGRMAGDNQWVQMIRNIAA